MPALEHIIRSPEERSHDTPILLQHGAWHGAWCWERWMDHLASRGFEVHTYSLPGHGNSPMDRRHINYYTIGDYVRALESVLGTISPAPVVVGHSMGGLILRTYIRKNRLPGAVLLASVPVMGVMPFLMRLFREHFTFTAKVFARLDLTLEAEIAHKFLLSPDNPITPRELYPNLVRESFLAAVGMLLPRPGRAYQPDTPVLTIAGEADRIFSVDEERTTARRYSSELVVFDGQAHNLMMEPAWQQVADRVVDWINKLNLP